MYSYIKSKKSLVFNKDIPHGSCLCETCENASLLAKGINKSRDVNLKTNAHDLVEFYSCNSDSKDCMYGECQVCNDFKVHCLDNDSDDDDSDVVERQDSVTFENWCRQDGKVSKISLIVDFDEAQSRWNETISGLKRHIYRKRVQVAHFNTQKELLKEGEVLVQVDYSENYKNQDQNEIQSAYFGHDCFSMFTACSYYKDGDDLVKKPIAIVSESSDHSRIAAFSCLSTVVQKLKEEIKVLKKVIVWSDGMTSQFRSRFTFRLLTTFDKRIDIEWHYMEAHHGKGPMDGVGGTIKNKIFKEVKSGRLIIRTPEEFAVAAQTLVPSITTIYLPISEMLKEPVDIENAPKIPETLKVHKVQRSFDRNSVPVLKFSKLSNEIPFFSQYYSRETRFCEQFF